MINRRAHGPLHGPSRLPTEPLLYSPDIRIAKPGQDMSRSREGQDIIPHTAILLIPLDQESFFTVFRVTRQGAIGKAKPGGWAIVIHNIDNAASVQPPPRPKGASADSDDLTFLDRGLLRCCLHPTQAKLVPALEGCSPGNEDLLTLTEFDPRVIHHVPTESRMGLLARG